MNQYADLLEDCRGSMPKGEFARLLGISHRMLTAVYAGERRLGLRVVRRLLSQFPERREAILGVFFALE